MERLLAPKGEEHRKLQLALDKLQRVEWIQNLAPWSVMGTYTFEWEASMASSIRIFKKFMHKLPNVSYVYCVEPNPGRCGYHLHSLWADCENVDRSESWREWFLRYGRARIEPVRSATDVSDYASKYLMKQDCWFDVKLQWHRKIALHDSAFQLTPSSSVSV